jgi:hypothetical protein
MKGIFKKFETAMMATAFAEEGDHKTAVEIMRGETSEAKAKKVVFSDRTKIAPDFAAVHPQTSLTIRPTMRNNAFLSPDGFHSGNVVPSGIGLLTRPRETC